ncbi:phytoene/squalene synthase family protein [Gordonia sp. PDNC005]|uniref:phytoene/squalene synthase family protein n=1 Tax=unclassified Gordonia (in: high G+C Gram-positive bacteria) TaxID=2657482 RepID=UPI001964E433|nr:phytoene/squalene synthase family protein [Gordonia sp. PDNC005]QRY60861.1 phytoene/squalene synthase family protein [Gordonia sp. PDNC005]
MSDVARGHSVARSVTARAGRTYYLASLMLPASRRRAVHALYAYARSVDDAVDSGLPPDVATARIDVLEAGLHAALRGDDPPAGLSSDDVDLLAALAAAAGDNGIPITTFDAFGHSMRMDLPGSPLFRNRYRTFDELAEYTYGSAAVIGIQMIPVLGADPSLTDGAALLGEAFQLTNFIRDVAEDLRRDRVYLPTDVLSVFGVDESRLRDDLRRQSTSSELRRAVAHLIAVNRDQYRRTTPAIERLPATTRPAIAAAARSYSDILRVIEDADHDVMAARAVVPRRTRVRHAAQSLFGAPKF